MLRSTFHEKISTHVVIMECGLMWRDCGVMTWDPREVISRTSQHNTGTATGNLCVLFISSRSLTPPLSPSSSSSLPLITLSLPTSLPLMFSFITSHPFLLHSPSLFHTPAYSFLSSLSDFVYYSSLLSSHIPSHLVLLTIHLPSFSCLSLAEVCGSVSVPVVMKGSTLTPPSALHSPETSAWGPKKASNSLQFCYPAHLSPTLVLYFKVSP